MILILQVSLRWHLFACHLLLMETEFIITAHIYACNVRHYKEYNIVERSWPSSLAKSGAHGLIRDKKKQTIIIIIIIIKTGLKFFYQFFSTNHYERVFTVYTFSVTNAQSPL